MAVQNIKASMTVFSVQIKNDLLQLFCRIPVKIGKMLINSYIFINLVLFSLGKTKFSMASCYIHFPLEKPLRVDIFAVKKGLVSLYIERTLV